MSEHDEEIAKGEKILKVFSKHKTIQKLLQKKFLGKSPKVKKYFWVIYQLYGFYLNTEKTEPKISDLAIKSIIDGKIGWNSEIFEEEKKRLIEYDEYTENPFDIADGVVECPKCGSRKTWSFQKQIRSCDEPMTTFSRCKCGHHWQYSG